MKREKKSKYFRRLKNNDTYKVRMKNQASEGSHTDGYGARDLFYGKTPFYVLIKLDLDSKTGTLESV